MMGMRILVASPTGQVLASALSGAFGDSTVTVIVADSASAWHREIAGNLRFDVVVLDLLWRGHLEYACDGLDVLEFMVHMARPAPVVLSVEGGSDERGYLEEAMSLHRHLIAGIWAKHAGLEVLIQRIADAAVGKQTLDPSGRPSPAPLFQLFQGQRGETAARLAGAIASGSVWDYTSLARAASVGLNTANKTTNTYVGPIILARGELPPGTPLTSGVVFRWCGIYRHYLISWCRRNGHGDVVGRIPPGEQQTLTTPLS